MLAVLGSHLPDFDLAKYAALMASAAMFGNFLANVFRTISTELLKWRDARDQFRFRVQADARKDPLPPPRPPA